MEEAKHFIGNQWVAPASHETIPVLDPSDGQVFAQLGARQRRRYRPRRPGSAPRLRRRRGATRAPPIAGACCTGFR